MMNNEPVRGLEDLQTLAERGRATLYPSQPKVVVGMSSCGLAAGAGELYDSLKDIIAKRQADIVLARTGCIGFCQREPLVDVVIPGSPRVVFSKLESGHLDGLVDMAGKGEMPTGPVMAYIEQPAGEMLGLGAKVNGNGLVDAPHLAELDFYSKQRRIASGIADSWIRVPSKSTWPGADIVPCAVC